MKYTDDDDDDEIYDDDDVFLIFNMYNKIIV